MSIKQLAISGAKWTTLSTIVTTIMTFLQLIILARILGPEAYGLMGMVLIVIGFAQTYADFGISNAIIYHQDTPKDKLSSLFWLNVMAGGVLFIIVVALSPLIAIFFNTPQLLSLVILSATSFLILPFGQQFQILLQKDLIFDKISIIQIISISISTGIAIILAVCGFGVYSLVWGSLSGTTIRSIGFLFIGLKRWKPTLHFKMVDLEGYLNFGLYQMGERTLNYFNSNIDKIIIGKMFSVEIFGVYSLAYNLVIYPFIIINPILSKIAFPVFAKFQNDLSALKNGYFKLLKFLNLTNFPIYLGFACTAYLIIPVFFGPKWIASILIIEILAGAGLLKSIGNPIGSLLLAKGYARLGFFWNLLLVFTQFPGIVIGAYYGGIIGVAIAILLLEIFNFGISYYLLVRRVLGPCFIDYLNTLNPAWWISLIMSISVISIGILFVKDFALPIQLITLISLGIFIYVGLLISFERNLVNEIVLSIFKSKTGE